ncbi:hypothetical protein MRX96_051110 [Rhipicephalus microplus]
MRRNGYGALGLFQASLIVPLTLCAKCDAVGNGSTPPILPRVCAYTQTDTVTQNRARHRERIAYERHDSRQANAPLFDPDRRVVPEPL